MLMNERSQRRPRLTNYVELAMEPEAMINWLVDCVAGRQQRGEDGEDECAESVFVYQIIICTGMINQPGETLL
jgi:hypothetical protein